MGEFTVTLPIYVETGVKKKRKHYLNLNLYRNMPHHLSNSLKKEFKRIAIPLLPKVHYKYYSLDYEIFLPNKLKRDIANLGSIIDKFFADALVGEGVVEEDNYHHLQRVVYRYGGYDKAGKGYVLVTVKELGEEDMLEV